MSENIRVRSIVGNYLEHARIFFFENDGKPEYYCASADWMPRNLDRRVEILFPVEKPQLREKLQHILECQLMDNVKASVLRADGSYSKVARNAHREAVNAQLLFCKEAKELARTENEILSRRIFIPETHHED